MGKMKFRRRATPVVYGARPTRTGDPYELLANAIVLDAVKCFRRALRKRNQGRAQSELRWFRTDWADLLCRGLADRIYELLESEYREVFTNGKE